LHLTFVGHEGCLPILLKEKNITNLPWDTILKISLDKQYSPDIDESGSDMMATDDVGTGEVRRKLSLIYPNYHDNNNQKNLKFDLTYKKWKKYDIIYKQSDSRRLEFTNSTVISNGNNTSNSNITTPSIAPSPSSMFDFGDNFDYEFSTEIAILALPSKAIHDHNFKSINVTYSGSQCFGSWFTQFLLPLGGVDTIVLNNVIYTMKKKGVLISKSGDYYTWSEKQYSKFTSLSEFIGIISIISIIIIIIIIIIIRQENWNIVV